MESVMRHHSEWSAVRGEGNRSVVLHALSHSSLYE